MTVQNEIYKANDTDPRKLMAVPVLYRHNCKRPKTGSPSGGLGV